MIILKKCCTLAFLLLLYGVVLQAQVNDPIPGIRPATAEELELRPNMAGKSMMTPNGWGGRKPFAFVFVGGTFPQVYTSKPDMIGAVGLGLGDSYKNVGVVSILNINNVSQLNTFSASVIISRHLARGTSMSIGGLNMLASKRSDAGASLYIAVSHASQRIKPLTPGFSRLCYTLGAGNGRFNDKSPKDISTGKSPHGTIVFGNMSFEVVKNLNVAAEWTGINLGFALGWRPPSLGKKLPFRMPALNIGIADLLRTSGERPRFIASIGHAFLLSKK